MLHSIKLKHSHKKRKDSLETQIKPAILRANVETQAVLEPIPLYCASRCKQTKKRAVGMLMGLLFFTFSGDNYLSFFSICVKM